VGTAWTGATARIAGSGVVGGTMSKVVPLFQNGTVQEIICEAADKGFTEILVVGKQQDGSYCLKKSCFSSTIETVGVIEMAKQWLLEQM